MVPISRDLAGLETGVFDVLVVGGGIVGACVARDAAMRGLRTALIERGDFGEGATANSLKIVHGGFRYLQRLDIRRTRASAREQAAWFTIARHLLTPLPVVVATHPGEFPSLPILAGVPAIYRATTAGTRSRAASFQGFTAFADSAAEASRRDRLERTVGWPDARLLSRAECISAVPELAESRPAGGLIFHDALLHSPERLVLEVVASAVDAGAVCLNHVELESPRRRGRRLVGARVLDHVSGATANVEARRIVVAAGAWTPALAARLAGRPIPPAPEYALAVNLVVPALGQRVAFGVTSRGGTGGAGGRRRLFVVPWRSRTLIGTAQFAVQPADRAGTPSEAQIQAFLAELAAATPAIRVDRSDVVLVHAGLLPCTGDSEEPRLLTRHRIRSHAEEGAPELLSVVSVKLTTARLVGEQVVDRLFLADGRVPPRSHTAVSPLIGGVYDLGVVRAAVRRELGRADEDVVDHLARTYGARFRDVLRFRANRPDWGERVVPDAPVIRAELEHAARVEAAVTVDDLLLRRTEIGPHGLLTPAAVRMAEEVLAGASGRSADSAAAGPWEVAPATGASHSAIRP